MNASLIADLERSGMCVMRGAMPPSAIEALRVEMERVTAGRSVAGLRDVERLSEAISELARSPQILGLATAILGPEATPVRVLFFDKTPQKNWPVLWHQDVTIAVQETADLEGYGPWSLKDGRPHVQPPLDVLEAMISLRIHVDDVAEGNGALEVILGSHVQGVLSRESIDALTAEEVVTCSIRAGDVMVMRPLLLHASARAENPSHRRVIHVEYCAVVLPTPLQWSSNLASRG